VRQIVIIGGGAAGIMAAVAAAREGAQVTVLEHKDRIAKKILATGNGRCNFTNTVQTPECYRSENPEFPWGIIRQFDMQQTVAFFLELGIYSKNRNGYLYPNSDQASSVVDVLLMELERLRIHILTETEAVGIEPVRHGFRIHTNKKPVSADAVILACGSKASPVTGSDGSGYALAKQLRHRMIPVLPALVQLRCKEKYYRSVAGVRVQGEVSIYADGEFLAKDCGELQLVNYGISGIPVFQVSRYAARSLYEKKHVTAVLNFMPDFEPGAFAAFLQRRIAQRPEKALGEFLVGLFHKKLCDLWLKLGGFDRGKKVRLMSDLEIKKLASLIQHFQTDVTETNSFEQAQICCGGVDTREVHPGTLESYLVPGVYFAGEILDVDGLCGGYNLQWAWSSGAVAGREAARATY